MLRARIGHDLLLLPSVAVLPRDGAGRVLLVRNADTGDWQTLGGGIDPDESPQAAAAREAREEIGVSLELGRLRDVLGGPSFRVRYPNNDEVAYVVAVFDAVLGPETPVPDGEETSEVAWFGAAELASLPMGGLTRALLGAVGLLEVAGDAQRGAG
jgi:8-oxo-dGTP pyrophosphatase MutT (NUDIX family)